MDIEIGGDTFTKKPNILEESAARRDTLIDQLKKQIKRKTENQHLFTIR
jgi:hypothetical protein